MANPNQPNQNRFQYRDQNGQLQILDLPGPAKISEHVILYPNRWQPVPTVNNVVFAGWDNFKCVVCNHWGATNRANGVPCHGLQCLNTFRARANDTENNRIEIRVTPSMGLGVFAIANIPNNRLLGEYLGDLRPPNDADDYVDIYQYDLPDRAKITSAEAGNWTRFVNHNCNPNVNTWNSIIGRRRAIVFRANRVIRPGEELTIHYGDRYFPDIGIDCTCDAHPGPHQPGGQPALFQPGVLVPVKVTLGTPIPSSPGQFQPFSPEQFRQIRRRDPSSSPEL